MHVLRCEQQILSCTHINKTKTENDSLFLPTHSFFLLTKDSNKNQLRSLRWWWEWYRVLTKKPLLSCCYHKLFHRRSFHNFFLSNAGRRDRLRAAPARSTASWCRETWHYARRSGSGCRAPAPRPPPARCQTLPGHWRTSPRRWGTT